MFFFFHNVVSFTTIYEFIRHIDDDENALKFAAATLLIDDILNKIARSTLQTDSKRFGRGGKRGKTSGRGCKGQTARAGANMRPEMRDIIKRLPKLRGQTTN